jgi:hypothetical protein
VVFNELDALTALHFAAAGTLLAAERAQILPMTQHADNIWNEEVLTFVHSSQEVLKILSLYTQTFLALLKEVLIYLLKMLCRNI